MLMETKTLFIKGGLINYNTLFFSKTLRVFRMGFPIKKSKHVKKD